MCMVSNLSVTEVSRRAAKLEAETDPAAVAAIGKDSCGGSERAEVGEFRMDLRRNWRGRHCLVASAQKEIMTRGY